MRMGFRLVRGFGQGAAERIVQARSKKPFASLDDLMLRAVLAKNEVEALAEAGALEPLVTGRRQALWAARAPRGFGLFRGVELETQKQVLPPLPRVEQLILDYERVGLSLTDHPMCHLRKRMAARGVVCAAKLVDMPHGRALSVAGVVLARQRPGTANGVVFITMEDETGTMNLVLFGQVFERYRAVARHSTLLFARGKLERQLSPPMPGQLGRPTPVIHVVVEHLERLDQSPATPRVSSRDFH
jgi:error-prone DNA polymerase